MTQSNDRQLLAAVRDKAAKSGRALSGQLTLAGACMALGLAAVPPRPYEASARLRDYLDAEGRSPSRQVQTPNHANDAASDQPDDATLEARRLAAASEQPRVKSTQPLADGIHALDFEGASFRLINIQTGEASELVRCAPQTIARYVAAYCGRPIDFNTPRPTDTLSLRHIRERLRPNFTRAHMTMELDQ